MNLSHSTFSLSGFLTFSFMIVKCSLEILSMLSFFSHRSIFIVLSISIIKYGTATDISESTHLIDHSLGFDVMLPVLACNAKFTGYKTVQWYKDFILLKNGSASLRNHFLALDSLMSDTEELNNVLKLQGYYWCKTEIPSTDHKYLFKIKKIHTYVGRLHATQDSLGDDSSISLIDKIHEKKKIYENEMQNLLFGFLPKPNTFVTNITPIGSELKVNFFLYVQQPYFPRVPFARELVQDQQQFDFVEDYLNGKTDVDAELYEEIVDWTNFRGISIKQIKLQSTSGCYKSVTLMPGDPPKELNWPYAEIGEIVIPEESCSLHNGLAVTRKCMGSFTSGAIWSMPSGDCDTEPEELTVALKKLYDSFGDEVGANIVVKLKNLTQIPEILSVTDIHIATNLLNELSQLPDLYNNGIDNLFGVINNLMDVNASSLDVAKDKISLTNRFLQIIDNVMKVSTEESKELQITKPHVLAESKTTKIDEEEHIIGIAVLSPGSEPTLVNGSVEFLLNGTKFPKHRSMAYFSLPSDLIFERESYLHFPCQVNLVYFKEWKLFPNPKNVLVNQNYDVLPSPVMYVGLSGGPAWNLSDPVKLYFRDELKVEIENPVCVHYDAQIDARSGGWSTEGCIYAGRKDGYFICHCNHLSIFAVILSKHPEHKVGFRMSTAVYVGCGISIIALSICVLLYLLSKVWRSTIDHHILFWLALSFLCSLILIFISEIRALWKPGCVIQAMIFHYFILVTFSWLLIQAILHLLRFYKKTDASEVPFFMLKCFFAAWGIPAIMITILALITKYELHHLENCWPIVTEVSEEAFIPVVCIFLLTLCINMSAAYAITCRFKKDFLIGDKKYNEPVLKFRIAVSIYLLFVLCWIFGYLALHKKQKELQILFSITTIVTAYYVSLFFIFQEISFWSLCGKLKKEGSDNAANDIVTYNAKTYKSTEEK